MPRLSDDDVIDFCVTEALAARAGEDTKNAQKEQEAKRFREDTEAAKRLPG